MDDKEFDARVRAVVKAGGAMLIQETYYNKIDKDWSKWLKRKPENVNSNYMLLIGESKASADALELNSALQKLVKSNYEIGILEKMVNLLKLNYDPGQVKYLPSSIGTFVLYLPPPRMGRISVDPYSTNQ